ncbi:MAG: hypothetical protein ABIH63_02795 [archaeon]
MKTMYKDHLLDECFDIDDLIRWTKTQMDHCHRTDHLEIYERMYTLLEKVKENQTKSRYQEEFGRDRKVEKVCLIDST